MLGMINLSCECFNMLVAIERSYLSVCQHVRVQISDSSASVDALVEFVRLLLFAHPHLYIKSWCVCMEVKECVPFRLYVSSCVSATYVLVRKCNHTG